MQGGHTKGFHRIAEIIDTWVGEGYLSLCNMKANLDHFRRDDGRGRREWRHVHEHVGCNQSPGQEYGMFEPPAYISGYV